MSQPLTPVVFAGHVDHGKSTLIGRLLADTGSLPDGRLEEVKASCERRGVDFEPAFLMDAMQAERDQGVTIDAARILLKSRQRHFRIIDAPGHESFLRHMVSGAAEASAAVLVIDAAEGVREQTRRHSMLLGLLGVSRIIIVVNKMDRVSETQRAFDQISAELNSLMSDAGLETEAVIPAIARSGEMVAKREGDKGSILSWWSGPSLLEALEKLPGEPEAIDRPLRMPVQDVLKDADSRIIIGRVESGRLSEGETVLLSPSGQTAKIAKLVSWPDDTATAFGPGEAAGFLTESRHFIDRGEMVTALSAPSREASAFDARLFWLADHPLRAGDGITLRLGTAEAQGEITKIHHISDAGREGKPEDGEVPAGAIADVSVRLRRTLALDDYRDDPKTGRFVLIDKGIICGGGRVSLEGYQDDSAARRAKASHIHYFASTVNRADREERTGHKGGVIWLTGLSGSGKSTLANALELALHRRGWSSTILDGDNLRHGLNADLGFSPDDRTENIRRVGEVAALFAQSGLIAISAFISPYRTDRDQARAAAGEGFHEIHVATSLEVCEMRDPKGLYKKARDGQIKEFTGISAPYEEPDKPELVVDAGSQPIETCVEQLLDYVDRNFRL
ncbi:adenylyl-sulfate kinase [Hyphobacterium sp.]|uniref:adenylyl-sulfate kinase n=1 Tax=Hyphobacterium sp. TaxID=2004662 RepID=UPI003BA878D7